MARRSLALGDPMPHQIDTAVVGNTSAQPGIVASVQRVANGSLTLHDYPSRRAALYAIDLQRVYTALDSPAPGPPSTWRARPARRSRDCLSGRLALMGVFASSDTHALTVPTRTASSSSTSSSLPRGARAVAVWHDERDQGEESDPVQTQHDGGKQTGTSPFRRR